MLTRLTIENAEPKERDYMLFDSENLYLRVYKSGRKTWMLRYRLDGTGKYMTLGAYPELSISDARKQRAETMRSLHLGHELTPQASTFGEVAERWYKEKKEPKLSSSALYAIRLRLKYLEKIQDCPVNIITRKELADLVREIARQKTPETARRCCMVLKMVFDYAEDGGEVDYPHCALSLSRVLTVQESTNFRSIHDPAEIGVLMRALDRIPSYIIRQAVKLIAYTFVRAGELRQARWNEIDFDNALWEIPSPHTKKRREQITPLSRQALAILRDVKANQGKVPENALVFPAPRGGLEMGTSSMMCAMRQLQQLPEGVRPQAMTIHGFRSMASTLLNERSWNKDAIERQLAHVDDQGVREIYNKAQYLDIRRPMMQWYADYLDVLRDGLTVPKKPN